MTPEAAVTFLREAARYFGNRSTGGEDSAFWSNVANADNCNKIAELIATMERQMAEHNLTDGSLKREAEGITARCECGWVSGGHFSSLAASAAMADHKDECNASTAPATQRGNCRHGKPLADHCDECAADFRNAN